MAKQDNKKEEELSAKEIAKLQEESEAIDAKKKAEAEAEKQTRIEARKAKEATEKTFTAEEAAAMIKAAIKEYAKNPESAVLDELDEVDPYQQKQLTIPRFPSKDGKWKFVVGFANTNTDEYFKDKEIMAFDVWDDLQKRNVAYAKVVFEDESEMTLPLLTLVKKSQKVLVDIVDMPKKDKSYSAGRTQVARVEGYTRKLEGTVPMKVTRYDYSFVVRLPDGKEIPVSKEVVNWQIVPQK